MRLGPGWWHYLALVIKEGGREGGRMEGRLEQVMRQMGGEG